MTHIPNEAVQAAVKAYSKQMDYNDNRDDAVKAAITAALPHLSAPCAVEVVKLNWVEVSYGFIAHTAFGTYKVKADVDQFIMINSGSEFPTSCHDNHFEAMSAAQADFERRILSCVVTNPVDVAAVREQCAKLCDQSAAISIERITKETLPHVQATIAVEFATAKFLAKQIRALSTEPAQGEQLPQDVIDLVIAGREFIYGDGCEPLTDEFNAFDKALEAFASRVPWENEPEEVPAPNSETGK